jgi:hypothetical protein
MIGVNDIYKISDSNYSYNGEEYSDMKSACYARYRDVMILKISTLPIPSITDSEEMVTKWTYKGQVYHSVESITAARIDDKEKGLPLGEVDTETEPVKLWYYKDVGYPSAYLANDALRQDAIDLSIKPITETLGERIDEVFLEIYSLFKSYYRFNSEKGVLYSTDVKSEFNDKPYNPSAIIDWISSYLDIDYYDDLRDNLIDPLFSIINKA